MNQPSTDQESPTTTRLRLSYPCRTLTVSSRAYSSFAVVSESVAVNLVVRAVGYPPSPRHALMYRAVRNPFLTEQVLHSLLWVYSPHHRTGAPSACGGFRMSSLPIVFGLAHACQDGLYRRTVHTVGGNPVIERIATTVNPINFATRANNGEVGGSMEERPLIPATRSAFPGLGSDQVPDPAGASTSRGGAGAISACYDGTMPQHEI